MKYAFGLFLVSSCVCSSALFSVVRAEDFVRPDRPMYSLQQMSQILEDARKAYAPNLPVRIVGTSEWADYVNHHHFVPSSCEGVPADFTFDYNWDGHKENWSDHRKLPSAEVTQTGEFLLWIDVCNYREMPRDECVKWMNMAVAHESQHHTQWMELAAEAASRASQGAPIQADFPSKLEDLRRIPGAEQAFMEKWGDCAHYQCREVEVYSNQFVSGQMGRNMAPKRLPNVNSYYNGCLASRWAGDFKRSLDLADVVFAWFGYAKQKELNPYK